MAEEQVFDALTPADVEILSEYISDPQGDVFTVKMPSGMAGATYARYSRAKGGWKTTFLKEFAKEGKLDVARADDLIARVLVSYGDDSVGELEGAHLSLENISNLGTKAVEDSRIGAAYIEQSSRYVVYDQRDTQGRFRYLQDPTKNPIMESGHRDAFVKGMDRVFEIYCGIVRRLQEHLKKLKPLKEAEYTLHEGGKPVKLAELTKEEDVVAFKRTHTFDLRSKACDIARVLLPAATLTNVGLFCNGRAYQGLLTRLYSSEMPEFHALAGKAHEALNHVIKRYVERAKRDDYIVETSKRMQALTDEMFADIPVSDEDDVVLLDNGLEEIAKQAEAQIAQGNFDPRKLPAMHQREFQTNVIAYMLYKFTEHPMRQIRDVVRLLPDAKRQEIINTYVGDRKHRRNKSGRALEYGYDLFFDILGDFGIFRDLHRQRILTAERQRLTTRRGFVELHPQLSDIGAESQVKECTDISSELYEAIHKDLGRDVAQYPVLFGFNIRFAQGYNDRQAQYYWELRTGKQGHPSYRRICQKKHELLRKRAPWRADMMKFVDHNDYFWSRAESEARQRQKEAKLVVGGEKEGTQSEEAKANP